VAWGTVAVGYFYQILPSIKIRVGIECGHGKGKESNPGGLVW